MIINNLNASQWRGSSDPLWALALLQGFPEATYSAVIMVTKVLVIKLLLCYYVN